MSKVLVTESHLEDIADAIRGKLGGSDTYRPGDMAAAIESIRGDLEALTARLNGVYVPTDPVDGYDEVTVQVPTFSASVVADAVLLSGEQVSVVQDGVAINTAPIYVQKTITENGTYDPGDDNAQAYSGVVVNVQSGEPLPMVVSASSTFSGSPKQPYGIFGDIEGNFWGSNSVGVSWWNINYMAPFNLKKVRLSNYYRISAQTYWHSSNITVRASNDGFATYTDLYIGTGLAQSETQFEIDLQNSDAYTEYRFIVSDATAYAGIGRVSLL